MFPTQSKQHLAFIIAIVVSIIAMAITASCKPQPQGGDILTVGVAAEPVKLDPHNSGDGASFTAYEYIVEGLVGWGKNGKLSPVLATAWQFSDDGTQVTIQLRKGVKFHDGTDFNAQAVKVNFDRIINPNLKLIGYSAFKDSIDGVDVVDDHTVKFDLKGPRASFIFDLNNTYAKIMSPDSLERSPDEVALHPIGTGPFRFVEWVPNQRVVVEAFDEYWGGRPRLDRIVYTPVPEAASRVAALEAGDIDIALGAPMEDITRLQASPKLQVLTGRGMEAYHYQINMRKEPLGDIRVRRALNYAVDKDSVIKTLYQGLAVPLDSVIAPAIPAHVTVGAYEYNPDKAKQLLAQAGYSQGLKLVLWTSDGRYLMDRQLAEAVAGYLRDVGIEVQIVSMEWATYLDKIRSPSPDVPPEYDLALLNAAPGSGDADLAWRLFVHSESWPPAYVNIAFYSNSEVDTLIEKAHTIFDEDERNAIHAEIQEIVWNDAPWIFLLSPQQVVVASTKVKGTYFTLLGLNVKDAWIEE